MHTIRVDICYRPLRIGWAIRSDDIEAFRQAVRRSYSLWGGRFNPILLVDREEEAKQLVDLFRVDLILPIGKADDVKAFPNKFPHLITPFSLRDNLFIGDSGERNYAQVLDIHNALVHLIDKPEWKAIKDRGVRLYTWKADDPLADMFLVHFGAYPSIKETGIDYRAMFARAAEATEYTLDPNTVIPSDTLDHPSIAYLSRHGLKRHYSVNSGWERPGFFVGDLRNIDDLVCYWNLRATDIPLWFVDPNHLTRYADTIPAWEKAMRESVAHRHESDRHIAVWSRCADIDEACKPFGDMRLLMRCRVSDATRNGLNVRAPMMHLAQVSVLGVMGRDSERPKISFALSEKPFCSEIGFYKQHLVASISFVGGLYGDEQHTLVLPYLPELNEFYARTMHFDYDRLRIEPGRVGFIIEATDHDTFLYAMPVADLMGRIFKTAGYSAKMSDAGLITRQLIAHLGGVNGARVFKIPGVRKLLKTHGPSDTFTKRSALQLIGSRDRENPDAKFSDYQDLYIEQRPRGTKLEPPAVFAYLVERGLFRIGAQLTCPSCRMDSWTPLDALKQRVMCELCGNEHDATRQLVNGEWHYRRSGVLGKEKNAQGAVSVALTLQQLRANIHGIFHDALYSPSLDLNPEGGKDFPTCEIDFVWVIPNSHLQKTEVILGECKDQGTIDRNDIDQLRCVADALPQKRFETFVLLSKLCPFTPEEIALAKGLNDEYRHRVILLTARELEPRHIFERTKVEFDIRGNGSTPEDLAQATRVIYFK